MRTLRQNTVLVRDNAEHHEWWDVSVWHLAKPVGGYAVVTRWGPLLAGRTDDGTLLGVKVRGDAFNAPEADKLHNELRDAKKKRGYVHPAVWKGQPPAWKGALPKGTRRPVDTAALKKHLEAQGFQFFEAHKRGWCAVCKQPVVGKMIAYHAGPNYKTLHWPECARNYEMLPADTVVVPVEPKPEPVKCSGGCGCDVPAGACPKCVKKAAAEATLTQERRARGWALED